MKAISIRNPWAHEILCELKKYEYRTWSTNYRGPLLICSSATPKIEDTIPGHALVVATLEDVTLVNSKNFIEFDLDAPPEGKLYAWHLTDTKAIKPFPVKGKLNFYNVDDELIEYIEEGDLSEEEALEIYSKYYEPLLYRSKRKK